MGSKTVCFSGQHTDFFTMDLGSQGREENWLLTGVKVSSSKISQTRSVWEGGTQQ